jgi:hypothetical protein
VLTPAERIYLFCIVAIVASQIARGAWDPVAVGAIGLFIGLIPAGRIDRQKEQERRRRREAPAEAPAIDPAITAESREVLRRYLDDRGGEA